MSFQRVLPSCQSHDHAFERSDDHGQITVYVWSPKTCHWAIKQKQGTYISSTWKDLLLIGIATSM